VFSVYTVESPHGIGGSSLPLNTVEKVPELRWTPLGPCFSDWDSWQLIRNAEFQSAC
jgi:hypothetical protein